MKYLCEASNLARISNDLESFARQAKAMDRTRQKKPSEVACAYLEFLELIVTQMLLLDWRSNTNKIKNV